MPGLVNKYPQDYISKFHASLSLQMTSVTETTLPPRRTVARLRPPQDAPLTQVQ